MKRLVISVVLTLVLVASAAVPAFAETTQGVTITATPSYISISNDTPAWTMGSVDESTEYWWSLGAPTWPLDDGECIATIINDGSVAVAITITGPTFTSWTLVSTITADDEVILQAWKVPDAEGDGKTLTTGAQAFISTLAKDGTIMWDMKLTTGTFSHGDAQTGIVTLTAS